MLLSRVLGGVGRTMISAGVLILLFVTYQLWGTGIRTDSAQTRLREEFRAKQEAVARTLQTTGSAVPGETIPGNRGSVSDTSSTRPATTTAPAVGDGPHPAPSTGAFAAPRPGAAIGQIQIPKIGADFQMVEGVDLSFLAEGPGHFPGTPFPGQPGNAALAGHRTTWKAPFNRIDELVPGDTVTIQTLQGTFTYEVTAPAGAPAGAPADTGHRIISPTETSILAQKPDQNTLTLMACHPKYSASQRIVVVAKLVGNPAPATEKSTDSTQGGASDASQEALLGGSGGELVGGHPESQNSAIEWGLAAAAIWLVAWVISRRWRSWRQWQRWAVYLGGFPIFLLPLFFAFENINRLLPAGY